MKLQQLLQVAAAAAAEEESCDSRMLGQGSSGEPEELAKLQNDGERKKAWMNLEKRLALL